MLKADKCKIKKEIHDKLNLTEQQLILITHEMKSKIKHMVEEVEEKVSTGLVWWWFWFNSPCSREFLIRTIEQSSKF
jgi:hypothetical protein